jgi:hypothetical protein
MDGLGQTGQVTVAGQQQLHRRVVRSCHQHHAEPRHQVERSFGEFSAVYIPQADVGQQALHTAPVQLQEREYVGTGRESLGRVAEVSDRGRD